MAGMRNCRICTKNLAGRAYLTLPAGAVKGQSGVCSTCCDQWMEKLGTKTLYDFVPAFIKAQTPETVPAMKKRIAELEALVQKLMNTEYRNGRSN